MAKELNDCVSHLTALIKETDKHTNTKTEIKKLVSNVKDIVVPNIKKVIADIKNPDIDVSLEQSFHQSICKEINELKKELNNKIDEIKVKIERPEGIEKETVTGIDVTKIYDHFEKSENKLEISGSLLKSLDYEIKMQYEEYSKHHNKLKIIDRNIDKILDELYSLKNGFEHYLDQDISGKFAVLDVGLNNQRIKNEQNAKDIQEVRELCKSIENSVNELVGRPCVAPVENQQSFADIVKIQKDLESVIENKKKVETIMVKFKNGNLKENENIIKKILIELKCNLSKFKIVYGRNNNIKIEISETEKLNMVKDRINQERDIEANIPSKFWPRVIIFNVNKEINDDDIKNEIYTYQENLDERHVKVVTRLKSRKKDCEHIILELEPRLRNSILAFSPIGIQNQRYFVKDSIYVKICSKCKQIGHTARVCKDVYSCEYCNAEHEEGACDTDPSDGYKCRNCVKSNKNRGTKNNINHSALSEKCNEYIRIKEMLIDRTEYV